MTHAYQIVDELGSSIISSLKYKKIKTMKKQIFFLIGMIFLIGITSAFECQDQTEFWNVPCDLVTPLINCSSNSTIINVNDTDINMTAEMTPVAGGVYNITFNYSAIATYSIILCDNTTASLDVVWGIEQSETNFNLWLMLFGIFLTLLIYGVAREDHIFLFFDGALMTLMGLWVLQDGISVYNFDYWWVMSFGWILIGIGIIMTIVSSIEMMGGAE